MGNNVISVLTNGIISILKDLVSIIIPIVLIVWLFSPWLTGDTQYDADQGRMVKYSLVIGIPILIILEILKNKFRPSIREERSEEDAKRFLKFRHLDRPRY